MESRGVQGARSIISDQVDGATQDAGRGSADCSRAMGAARLGDFVNLLQVLAGFADGIGIFASQPFVEETESFDTPVRYGLEEIQRGKVRGIPRQLYCGKPVCGFTPKGYYVLFQDFAERHLIPIVLPEHGIQ